MMRLNYNQYIKDLEQQRIQETEREEAFKTRLKTDSEFKAQNDKFNQWKRKAVLIM